MIKPNIVFLHAHNTGQYVQPYGHAVPTPRIQHLAEQGVLFRKAFCVSPTCSPSRASFLSGQWPHGNGMIGLAHRGWRMKDYSRTLVQVLKSAGYETVLAGLQHVTKDKTELGYDVDLHAPSQGGPDVAAAAVKYLAAKPTRPFFLDVGIRETHRAFPEPDERDDPRYVQPPANLPDTPRTRYDMAGLRASARIMDHSFGLVLDAIDQAGLADNTFVICLCDHGLQFPGHMATVSDRGLATFFILRGPGRTAGFTGGKVIDAMVTHLDLFPTICELADIAPPDWIQGKSILPLVDGRADRIHERIFAEVTFHAAYDPQRCVRTERWKYIRRFGERRRIALPNTDRGPSRDEMMEHGLQQVEYPAEGLYDLIFDPNEMNNLVESPRHQQVLKELRTALDDWMHKTNDPLLAGHVDPPSGTQLCHPDGLHPGDRVMDMP